MYNSFLKFEEDFRLWINDGYPEINPMSRDFLLHLNDPGGELTLFKHSLEAIQRTIYSYERLNFNQVLLNIVTGGGKTAIIAATIAWLKYAHNIDKFIVLCPNTIVRDRLEDDFLNAKVFKKFNLFPSGTEHYANEMGLHILNPDTTGILDSGVILGNIHQLYQSTINGKRNLAFLMRYIDQLAIFNDEAHNTPAPEYESALRVLSSRSKFRLDTTGTPDRADGKSPDSKMVFEFDISQAQATVPPIIKSVVVYQPKVTNVQLTYTNQDTGEKRTVDEMDVEFEKIEKGLTSTQWVTDPEPMSKQIEIALNRLEEQKIRAVSMAQGRYNPILFVVSICIKDARQAQKMLQDQFNINTLLVTEESEGDERILAGIIGKKGKALDEARINLEKKFNPSKAVRLIEEGSKLQAVVSVLMLREGWDLPAVCVILLLRKFSSRVYGQQVIGRGLRLNVRNEDLQEIVAVIDHEKLNHQWLWDILNAKVKKEIDQGTLFGIEEDLPPKRKEQLLVNPENLIDIPEPCEEDDEGDFEDIFGIEIVIGDFPNWYQELESFEYEYDIEITRVEIDTVTGKNLFEPEGFYQILDGPSLTRIGPIEKRALSKEELVELLKESIRDLASELLAEEGIGSNELGYLYSVLMDHVRRKMLDNKSAGICNEKELQRAIHLRVALQSHIAQRPGLVTSIVKYKNN